MTRIKGAAYAAVPAVIESGRVVDVKPNWKERGYDSYTIAAPVTIAGERHVVAAIVHQHQASKRYYLHHVETEKALQQDVDSAGSSASQQGGVEISGTSREAPPATLRRLYKIKREDVKLRLDANGEPVMLGPVAMNESGDTATVDAATRAAVHADLQPLRDAVAAALQATGDDQALAIDWEGIKDDVMANGTVTDALPGELAESYLAQLMGRDAAIALLKEAVLADGPEPSTMNRLLTILGIHAAIGALNEAPVGGLKRTGDGQGRHEKMVPPLVHTGMRGGGCEKSVRQLLP